MIRRPPTSSARPRSPIRLTLRTAGCLALTAMAVGCGAPKAYVRAMSAASVDIPADVQRVAVIDRSRPKNVGEAALGVLEGVVTGEAPLEDNEGRSLAIRELVATLEAAPRFEVVRPALTPKDVDSTLMDTPWTFKGVQSLCKEHGCDAVIALETFDTDAKLTMGMIEGAAPAPAAVEPEPAAGGGSRSAVTDKVPPVKTEAPAPAPAPAPASDEPPPMTHWAQRETRLNATWRMYDADSDVILDEERDRVIGSRARKEAYSTDDAVAKLASAATMINADGRKLGREYGVRISPNWVGLQRRYFASGPLKLGKRYVLAGDWEGAAETWKAVVDDPSTSMKVRGKARHNLALAAEVKGQLKKAHKLAQKAAVENNHKHSQGYARSLERRIEEQARVEAQLAAPEESE